MNSEIINKYCEEIPNDVKLMIQSKVDKKIDSNKFKVGLFRRTLPDSDITHLVEITKITKCYITYTYADRYWWRKKAYKKKKTVKDGRKERIQREVLYLKQSSKMYPNRPFDKAYKIKPEQLEPTTLEDYIATIPPKRLEKLLKLKDSEGNFALAVSLLYGSDSD